MLAFIFRRLLQSAAVLLVVALIAFGLFNFTGDPVSAMLGQQATTEERVQLRKDLGLARPFYVQFARFVGESAKVVLKLPQDGRRRLQGKISRVEGSTVVFTLEAGEFVVDAANIEKAKLMPDWIALGLAPAVDESGRDARPGKQKKKPGGKKPAAKTPTNEKSINSRAARKPSDAE